MKNHFINYKKEEAKQRTCILITTLQMAISGLSAVRTKYNISDLVTFIC